MDAAALPAVEPTMDDLLEIFETTSKIGLAVAPLLQHTELANLWIATRTSKQLGVPTTTCVLDEQAVHELQGVVTALAKHAYDLVIVCQLILAAHDRLHANPNNGVQSK
jgi:hypothetical protein